MRKLLFLIAVFVFAGGLLFAGPIEWGGSFTFRVGIDPENPMDIDGPGDLADVSADIDVQVDDFNLVHTSVGATSGNEVTVGDTYLKTDWILLTTKLGVTDYGTFGWGVSDKDYETKTKATSGPGISVEVPVGAFTIGGAATIEKSYGVGLKYSKGFIDGIGIGYIGNIVDDNMVHALAGGVKIVSGNFSSGIGARVDDTVWSYGLGAKYAFDPAWAAVGVGVEDGDASFGADVGADFGKVGMAFILSYIEYFNEVNMNIWYKPGVIKFKLGYDWLPKDVDEVYIEVSADF